MVTCLVLQQEERQRLERRGVKGAGQLSLASCPAQCQHVLRGLTSVPQQSQAPEEGMQALLMDG